MTNPAAGTQQCIVATPRPLTYFRRLPDFGKVAFNKTMLIEGGGRLYANIYWLEIVTTTSKSKARTGATSHKG